MPRLYCVNHYRSRLFRNGFVDLIVDLILEVRNLVPEILDVALKFVDAEESDKVSHAMEDDSDTDENGQRASCDIRIHKS